MLFNFFCLSSRFISNETLFDFHLTVVYTDFQVHLSCLNHNSRDWLQPQKIIININIWPVLLMVKNIHLLGGTFLFCFVSKKFNEKKVQQQCDQQFFSTPFQSIHDIFSFSLHSKEGERRQKRHFVFSANLFINFWCCCSFCCCCCCCEQEKIRLHWNILNKWKILSTVN